MLLAAIFSILAAACIHAQSPPHFLTLTNPTPNFTDNFGFTLVTVGDRWLVGAPNDDTAGAFASGAAYLLNPNGTVARTFINPAPANGYFFGNAIAVVGNDRFLIGAPLSATPGPGSTNTGAVYRYHTNGTLLRTFLRPTPQAQAAFGSAVAAVGSERVLIGAAGDNVVGTQAGAAYLFHTNGTLLVTITNPTPIVQENLGAAVAAVGGDMLLVGAPRNQAAGAAYLFDTNGTLMATFLNPTPFNHDGFGRALAPVGHDRVLVGAPSDDTSAEDAGIAFLYHTNDTLLTTFTNPAPADFDYFGVSVAIVGSDRILIGSSDNGAESFSGEAYLFSTNGALLMTIANPAPASGAYFGASVADGGAGRALIGAGQAGFGGLAYVFELSPTLRISQAAVGSVTVSWPSAWDGWELQQNTDVGTGTWTLTPESMADDGTNKFIIVNPPVGNRFYRLFKP